VIRKLETYDYHEFTENFVDMAVVLMHLVNNTFVTPVALVTRK